MGLILYLIVTFLIIFIIGLVIEKRRFKLMDGYNKLDIPDDIPYYRGIPTESIEEEYFL